MNVTAEQISAILGDNFANGDELMAVTLANSWLNSYKLVEINPVPEAIVLAAAKVAEAYVNGDMFAGLSERSVKQKTVKADSLEVSTTYADGETLQSRNEIMAITLISPYLLPKSNVKQIRVVRA